MERDGFIAHGATELLKERLCGVSDATEMVYCLNCSTVANMSRFDDKTECHYCGNKGKFGRYTIPYAFKLVTDFFIAIGFNMKINMVLETEAVKRIKPVNMKKQAALAAVDIENLEEDKVPNEIDEEDEEEMSDDELEGAVVRDEGEEEEIVEEEVNEFEEDYE